MIRKWQANGIVVVVVFVAVCFESKRMVVVNEKQHELQGDLVATPCFSLFTFCFVSSMLDKIRSESSRGAWPDHAHRSHDGHRSWPTFAQSGTFTDPKQNQVKTKNRSFSHFKTYTPAHHVITATVYIL